MKISADTEWELDQAIAFHESDGWRLVQTERQSDGSYIATLERNKSKETDPK